MYNKYHYNVLFGLSPSSTEIKYPNMNNNIASFDLNNDVILKT